MSIFFDIVFDGPPGPKAGRFVEVEDDSRKSIRIGEWVERDDGYWALRISRLEAERERDELIKTFIHTHKNNGVDDSCGKCGLDLRNPIHRRAIQ